MREKRNIESDAMRECGTARRWSTDIRVARYRDLIAAGQNDRAYTTLHARANGFN